MNKKYRLLISSAISRLFHVIKLLFFWGISIVGFALLVYSKPIPGTDQPTTTIIALLLIGVGGALARIFTENNRVRRHAKIWKKEMQKNE